MSADYCDVIKQGYVKFKSKAFGWSKRWTVLRKASSKGPRRLEKYDSEKSAMQAKDCKCINLTPLMQVRRTPEDAKKFGIKIIFIDGSTRIFACDSEYEAQEWLRLLQDGLNSNNCTPASERINHNLRNLDEMYNTYMCPSPKTEVSGECLLQITNESLRILDINTPHQELIAWPLGAIRKYNSDSNKFTIETGRHCETGEAIFIFSTVHGEKIYQALRGAANAIAAAQQSLKTRTEPLKPLNRPVVSNVSRTRSAPQDGTPANRPAFNYSTSLPTGTNNPNISGLPLPCLPDEEESVKHSPVSRRHTDSAAMVEGGYLHQSNQDRDTEPSVDDRYENASTLNSLCRTQPAKGGATGGQEELDYIYEEKNLTNNFRKYLSSRKDESND